MKFSGWVLALAAAGLTPLSAQTPPEAGAQGSQSSITPTTAAPAVVQPSTTAPGAVTDPTPAASAVAPGAQPVPTFDHAAPTPRIGMPDGRMGTQDQFTPIGVEGAAFHNNWLLLLCAAISLFVLGLLGYTMIRYRRGAHPTPSRTSHNTFVEVVWTLVPVLILVAIAIPSIRLIRHQYSPPPADLTVKVIGNQWYWSYQYPDNGGFEIVSNMLKEPGEVAAGARARTERDGPRQLAVDERLVIPAGAVVKFIVTSNDVIHSFAVPSFWTKIDANPGILNETWVKVDRPGVYFGQCSELCGARHAYMPIAVEVVTPQRFAQWVATKGGTMPGARPAPTADSTAATTVTPTSVTPAPTPTPTTGNPTGAPPAAAGNGQPGVANRATDGSN
jgi:cytochrome c oxidase subunit 2